MSIQFVAGKLKGEERKAIIQDTHVGLHHPQGKKVEWEKMFRHRDRRSLEPCEPESKTGPGGCRNHALLRWREDPFR